MEFSARGKAVQHIVPQFVQDREGMFQAAFADVDQYALFRDEQLAMGVTGQVVHESDLQAKMIG